MEAKYRVNISHELEEFRKHPTKSRLRLIPLIILLCFLYAGVTSLRSGRTRTGFFMLAFAAVCSLVCAFIYYLTRLPRYVQRVIKTGPVLFFEDHFETQGQNGHRSYDYRHLMGIKETETEFYLTVEAGRDVVIQKVDCSGELISFLSKLQK
jgi:hypothetical protein